MSNTALLSATAVAAALLACGPAQAAPVMRAWVSGHGTDAAGCGAPITPCRSLQYVHDNIIAANGEIDILDPAGYGAVTITKAISIVNDGVGTAGVQQPIAGQPAIQINAGSGDAVTLRGLSVDGLNVASDGISLGEAGKLTVINCVVRHFTHDGVYLQPGSGTLGLLVDATIAADNGNNGFDISPGTNGQVHGMIDHSIASTNGGNGVVVWGLATVGNNQALVTVANSDLSGNTSNGIYAKGSASKNTIVFVRADVADFNDIGYLIDAGAQMFFSQSEALYDTTWGVDINLVGNNGASAITFRDNAFGDVYGQDHGIFTAETLQ